jgi:hypothetical protein
MKLTRVAPVKGSKCAKKASHALNFAGIGGAQFIWAVEVVQKP